MPPSVGHGVPDTGFKAKTVHRSRATSLANCQTLTLPNDTRDQMIRAPVSTPARAAPTSKTIRRVRRPHGRARGIKPSAP